MLLFKVFHLASSFTKDIWIKRKEHFGQWLFSSFLFLVVVVSIFLPLLLLLLLLLLFPELIWGCVYTYLKEHFFCSFHCRVCIYINIYSIWILTTTSHTIKIHRYFHSTTHPSIHPSIHLFNHLLCTHYTYTLLISGIFQVVSLDAALSRETRFFFSQCCKIYINT